MTEIPPQHLTLHSPRMAEFRMKYFCYVLRTRTASFLTTKLWAYTLQALGTVKLWKNRVREFMGLGKWTAAKLLPVIPIVSAFLLYTWQYTRKQKFREGLGHTLQMLPLPYPRNRNWSPELRLPNWYFVEPPFWTKDDIPLAVVTVVCGDGVMLFPEICSMNFATFKFFLTHIRISIDVVINQIFKTIGYTNSWTTKYVYYYTSATCFGPLGHIQGHHSDTGMSRHRLMCILGARVTSLWIYWYILTFTVLFSSCCCMMTTDISTIVG
jgi:hypothetical protein